MNKKIYKYQSTWNCADWLIEDWEMLSQGILKREGYRIEIEKIKPRFLSGHTIYFYYVEEKSNVPINI